MTDKELKRLKRTELLEMLLNMRRENDSLRQELEEAKKKLEDRMILTEKAGSIAEAALQLNLVFETAQKAADQYLMNVRRLSDENPEGDGTGGRTEA
jgi:transposase-like protein